MKAQKTQKRRKIIMVVCLIVIAITSTLGSLIVQHQLSEKQLLAITTGANMTNELSKLFSTALLSGKEEVDLSAFSMSDKELTADLVKNAYSEAYFQSPYMIGTTERLKNYDETTKIATIDYDINEWQRKRKQVKAHRKVQAIVKDKIYYEMDDLQKAQVLNDYLCETITYSKRSELLGTADDIRNVYGAIIEKKAVCLGYAYAYKALMDEVGIPCVVVVGHAREYHAWNKISIDGKWRVVDVTWNDSPQNKNQYFNLTDAENADHEQYDYFVLSEYVADYIAN
ncbi:hypothetical protein I6N95_14940 [Vagococcus sp. BWB3-3]|uniref:Transglutaminase-like domain-containing protein n=1 Tax=Vagococcus allomyrinae TaxID=2794353 RepID=A0A940SVW2_9ENTE|nr:transglutaminase domain-containing protein [Vagococcus allomyrinae]MBP1042314.1 hypothetical protein [Vagococcus allomyrinae]